MAGYDTTPNKPHRDNFINVQNFVHLFKEASRAICAVLQPEQAMDYTQDEHDHVMLSVLLRMMIHVLMRTATDHAH